MAAMAPRLSFSLLLPPLLLLLLLSLASSSSAVDYVVGGNGGWTTPERANTNFTTWAASTTFYVGDKLEFNYVPKAHNVLEVRRTDFRFCNASDPLVIHDDASGKTVVVLQNPGNYYFIDGVGDHCSLGQKFQAKVLSSSSITSSPSSAAGLLSGAVSPSEAPTPAMPPAMAAASGFAVSPLFILLSIVFLFFLH